MPKVLFGLLVAVLATIGGARLAYDATANTGTEPENRPWDQNQMEFSTWNGEKWTAWILNDTFEQIPQNTRKWHRKSNASLAFIDWDGRPWQVKINGDEFLLADRGDWSGAIEHSTAIRYRDWAGRPKLRTASQLRR